MEAEYMGEVATAKELLFDTNLFHELNPSFQLQLPIQLFGDNEAALKFAEERTVNDRVKHIDLRHHYLQTLVDNGVICMNYVCTNDNIADLQTKPLDVIKTKKFTDYVVGPIQQQLKALHAKLTHLNARRHANL